MRIQPITVLSTTLLFAFPLGHSLHCGLWVFLWLALLCGFGKGLVQLIFLIPTEIVFVLKLLGYISIGLFFLGSGLAQYGLVASIALHVIWWPATWYIDARARVFLHGDYSSEQLHNARQQHSARRRYLVFVAFFLAFLSCWVASYRFD